MEHSLETKVWILKHRNKRSRTHALDCRWVRGVGASKYEVVDAANLPPEQPRCRKCGGGR